MSVSNSCRYCKSPDCQGCTLYINDIRVVVGGREYRPSNWNSTLTVGEPLELDLNVILDNHYYIQPHYRYASHVNKSPKITNVIFNPPATIVFWSDKTKTVVKCDYTQEPYDPEKGIAMAIAKKMMGDNKYEYYNVFKHWLKRWNIRKTEGKTLTPPIPEDNPTEFYR